MLGHEVSRRVIKVSFRDTIVDDLSDLSCTLSVCPVTVALNPLTAINQTTADAENSAK